jgi:hypothetical protein
LTHVTRDKLGFTIAVALTGAFLCAFGVRALQRPTTLEIVDNRGEDGSGMQRWGNARKTTAQQGTMVGAVCIAIGAVALVSGFFLGALRPW